MTARVRRCRSGASAGVQRTLRRAGQQRHYLVGTVTTTNHHAAAPFIGVLRVRDGKIAGWREYQDVPAIQRALGSYGK
jgi:ketosteroid isomerase-like protein